MVCFTNTLTFAARHFWRRRGARDEHTLYGSERSGQRSLRQKGLPPGLPAVALAKAEALRRFWLGASWLVGCSPTLGDAPSSSQNRGEMPAHAGCLAPGQNQPNERHRIYAHQYLDNPKSGSWILM